MDETKRHKQGAKGLEGGTNKERKYCFHSVSSERQAWLSDSKPSCFSWLSLPPSSPVDSIFGQTPVSTVGSSFDYGKERNGEVAEVDSKSKRKMSVCREKRGERGDCVGQG